MFKNLNVIVDYEHLFSLADIRVAASNSPGCLEKSTECFLRGAGTNTIFENAMCVTCLVIQGGISIAHFHILPQCTRILLSCGTFWRRRVQVLTVPVASSRSRETSALISYLMTKTIRFVSPKARAVLLNTPVQWLFSLVDNLHVLLYF